MPFLSRRLWILWLVGTWHILFCLSPGNWCVHAPNPNKCFYQFYTKLLLYFWMILLVLCSCSIWTPNQPSYLWQWQYLWLINVPFTNLFIQSDITVLLINVLFVFFFSSSSSECSRRRDDVEPERRGS